MMPESGQRRRQILEATRGLAVRYGLMKTTVDDIARAAGVSKGAVYLEFSSKEALYTELVRWEFRTYLAAVQRRVADDPVGGRLSRIYRHCIDEAMARPFVKALYTQDDLVVGDVLRRHGAARYRPRVLLGADFVARMQAARLVRADIAPELLSHVMAIMSTGLLMADPLLRDGDQPPLSDTVELLVMFLVNSLELTADGDVAAGKRAFMQLCDQLDGAIAQ